MAFKFSTELRKQQCFSGSLRSILDGSVIRVYEGPVPQSADAAIAGDNGVLCEISAAGAGVTFEPTSSAPILTKSLSEVWQGDVLKSGRATFFRVVKPADTGVNTTNEVRIQGTVGGPAEDLTISSSELVQGAPQRIEYFAIALLEYA